MAKQKQQTVKIGATKVTLANKAGSLVVEHHRSANRTVNYGFDAYGEGQTRATYARQIIREAGMQRPDQKTIDRVAKAIDTCMRY